MHVAEIVRIAVELRVVPADVGLLAGDLLREQVGLVQEQDDGDALEVDVVHDRVEDIERFLETIRFPAIQLGVGLKKGFNHDAINITSLERFLTIERGLTNFPSNTKPKKVHHNR